MGIYLDFNATTPLDPRVLEGMLPFLSANQGNPSSPGQSGRIAKAAIEQAREQVAALVSAHPSQVIFTAGGSEANNLALKGCILEKGLKRVVFSAIEHPSVRRTLESIKEFLRELNPVSDFELTRLPVASDGRIDVQNFQELAKTARPELVTVMLVNNETGAFQDIAGLTHCGVDSIYHTDAVQAAGKMAINFADLGVDLLTLSAHKIYGPKGVGALVVDKRLALQPLIHGGGQEKGMRSGTENVAGIVGFGLAAELALNELDDRRRHMAELRDVLERGLTSLAESLSGRANIRIFSQAAKRIPNTSFFGIEGIDGEALVLELDRAGIEIASGSACSSMSGKPSEVLLAMGVSEEFARTAIRVSVGKDTTREEVTQFLAQLQQQVERLKNFDVLMS